MWPFIYLLLLAGLQAISRDQLDAATVDGAGWWARLRYIVFGNTRPSSTVTLLSRAGVTALLVFIAVPVLYLVDLALSPNATVALGGTAFRQLTLRSFTDMWSAAPVARGLLNSVIIAGISAALAVIPGLAAAYPLARLAFRARKPLLYSLLGSQSIPGLALLLPLYIMLVAPLMAPAIVVSLVFAFLVGWNDVLFASALQNQTIAVTLEQFGLAQSEGFGAQPLYGDLMAAALVSAIPVVALYLAFSAPGTRPRRRCPERHLRPSESSRSSIVSILVRKGAVEMCPWQAEGVPRGLSGGSRA